MTQTRNTITIILTVQGSEHELQVPKDFTLEQIGKFYLRENGIDKNLFPMLLAPTRGAYEEDRFSAYQSFYLTDVGHHYIRRSGNGAQCLNKGKIEYRADINPEPSSTNPLITGNNGRYIYIHTTTASMQHRTILYRGVMTIDS